MEKFKKYVYCYLDKVYVNSTGIHSCKLIFSDKFFEKIATFLVTKEALISMIVSGELEGLITDFEVEDTYFKCNVNVQSEDVQSIVGTKYGVLEEVCSSITTIYDLFREGIIGQFLFIPSNMVEGIDGDWYGEGVMPFRGIKFSESTMTVMYTSVVDGEMFNNNLIYMDNGILKVNTFYFAVPSNKSTALGILVKSCKINNVDYNVYKSMELPIYQDVLIVSHPLVNKCVSMGSRIKNVIKVLDGMITMFSEDDSKVTWTGGTTSREYEYGISFESNIKKISKGKAISFIQGYVNRVLSVANSKEELWELVKSIYGESDSYEMINIINEVYSSTSNVTERLGTAIHSKKSYQALLYFSEVFLYKLRANAYFRGASIANPRSNQIFGSEEFNYTTVKEGKFYGNQ